ncbi:MAG: hypothetical protein EAX95_08320 [Candidatus Thorarchaeota archaeon]|nr:hypothetical protein [Candidatus Thorarchaeota archaeon]
MQSVELEIREMRKVVYCLCLLAVVSFGAMTLACAGNPNPSIAHVNSRDQAVISDTYVTRYSIEIYSNEDMQSLALSESWEGDGSEDHPYVITGYILTGSDIQPIRIWDVDLHWEFRNNFIEPGAVCGTWFYNAANGLVENNTIQGRHSGMVIQECSDLIIRDNVVAGNTENGIEILSGSTNLIIEDNTISNNAMSGMLIPFSDHFLITENVISASGTNGIEVAGLTDSVISGNTITGSGTRGMYLYGMKDSVVSQNSIGGSGTNGILVGASSYIVCTENWVVDSISHAVELNTGCSNLTVKGNVFVNSGESCQACDNGADNEFIYNYFDDWTSPDDDADGYVDVPYSIVGSAGNQDPHPRAATDVEIPTTTATSSTTTTTTGTSTTTTATTTANQPMLNTAQILSIAGGSVAVVLVVAIILTMKRRA